MLAMVVRTFLQADLEIFRHSFKNFFRNSSRIFVPEFHQYVFFFIFQDFFFKIWSGIPPGLLHQYLQEFFEDFLLEFPEILKKNLFRKSLENFFFKNCMLIFLGISHRNFIRIPLAFFTGISRKISAGFLPEISLNLI